jgi:hypothetical protein
VVHKGQQPGGFKGLRYRMPELAPRSCAAWGDGRDHPCRRHCRRAQIRRDRCQQYVGPWPDIGSGSTSGRLLLLSGFHEPGANQTLGINKTLWDGLTPSERADRSRGTGRTPGRSLSSTPRTPRRSRSAR